jgi:hypothetical protein
VKQPCSDRSEFCSKCRGYRVKSINFSAFTNTMHTTSMAARSLVRAARRGPTCALARGMATQGMFLLRSFTLMQNMIQSASVYTLCFSYLDGVMLATDRISRICLSTLPPSRIRLNDFGPRRCVVSVVSQALRRPPLHTIRWRQTSGTHPLTLCQKRC